MTTEKMIGRKARRGPSCRFAARGCTCFEYTGPRGKAVLARAAKRREQAEVRRELARDGHR
jgi:hypothetical protein